MMFAFALFLQVFFAQPQTAYAATSTVSSFAATQPAECQNSFFGIPRWYQYLDATLEFGRCTVDFSLKNADGSFNGTNIVLVALAITDMLLRIAALVSVAFVIIGGFKMLTSQGDPEGVKGGRNTAINALVGLVITIIASAVVSFIGNRLG